MASATSNNISALSEDVNNLRLSSSNKQVPTNEKTNHPSVSGEFEPHLSGFETRELYRIAINFYKEKEGKAVHLSYEDKLKLMAFTQQAIHGKCTPENSPPLGVLDVIGKDRRLAWQNLGDISKDQAMEGFVVLLDKLCPLFRTVVEAQKRNIEEQERRQREEESLRLHQEQLEKEAEEERKREEEERQKSEHQRRQIQEALNQQTYYQFKAYAEQQYPGNPEQQGVLIRQLQEQHYHRYMQQLHQNRLMIEESNEKDAKKDIDIQRSEEKEREAEESSGGGGEKKIVNDDNDEDNEGGGGNGDEDEEDDSDVEPDWPHIATPKMWTRHGVEKFKNDIRNDGGDAVIKIGHGETVTVRVPTHEDGACVFWEFATDGYDIGFGVYFEWSKPDTNQVSVHISESEDDDDEQDFDSREDLECGDINEDLQSEFKPSTPPISVIIPVFRRDSQEEVYAGSHEYPGHGVYLLKFDNSYSLWRSKTLYYKVYYTKPGFSNNPT